MEILGVAVTLCVLAVFLISLMKLLESDKVFYTTLILATIIIISLHEAGIIFPH